MDSKLENRNQLIISNKNFIQKKTWGDILNSIRVEKSS